MLRSSRLYLLDIDSPLMVNVAVLGMGHQSSDHQILTQRGLICRSPQTMLIPKRLTRRLMVFRAHMERFGEIVEQMDITIAVLSSPTSCP